MAARGEAFLLIDFLYVQGCGDRFSSAWDEANSTRLLFELGFEVNPQEK
jgi:hypothetical protein